jgi:hypothetical protein
VHQDGHFIDTCLENLLVYFFGGYVQVVSRTFNAHAGLCMPEVLRNAQIQVAIILTV